MVFPETPIFDALNAVCPTGIGPAPGRHRPDDDPPTVELPTAPIPIAKEDVRGR